MFTPTQQAIIRVLSDGRPHANEEIRMRCCEHVEPGTIRVHVCTIRKILADRGEDIVCILKNRRTFYQHVRLLIKQ